MLRRFLGFIWWFGLWSAEPLKKKKKGGKWKKRKWCEKNRDLGINIELK